MGNNGIAKRTITANMSITEEDHIQCDDHSEGKKADRKDDSHYKNTPRRFSIKYSLNTDKLLHRTSMMQS